MTGALIADASIAIGWVHPGRATEKTAAALDAIAAGAGLEDGSLRAAARAAVELWDARG